ncbi:MAG: serine/threonine-protein kinase [Polyangiaceae bacterium]
MSQEERSPIAAGQSIDGKYRVERILGRGGIGIVAKAEHLILKHPVALKVLRQELAREQRQVVRFLREARAAVRLESEHVARVLDVGTLPDGAPYMVMEYLEGEDLAQRLARSGPLAPQEVAGYLLEACDGLAEAHSAGIVHRDVKPANLFLARGKDGAERLRVLDFGIAKAAESESDGDFSSTETGGWVGSPRYMSPEQMRPRLEVDARTDIWALGITAYELMSGASPFEGESMSEICAAVLHVDPAPIHERVDLPRALGEAVMRCLQKDPAHRYGSIREFASEIAPFAPAKAQPKLARIHKWKAAEPSPRAGGRAPAGNALTVSSHGPASVFSAGNTDELAVAGAEQTSSRRWLRWAALVILLPLAAGLLLLDGAPLPLTAALQPQHAAHRAFQGALSLHRSKPTPHPTSPALAPPEASEQPGGAPPPRREPAHHGASPKDGEHLPAASSSPAASAHTPKVENPLLMDRE